MQQFIRERGMLNDHTRIQSTAYELQQQAQEAEQALGGVYSSLAESVQVPLAHVLLIEENPAVLQDLLTDAVGLNIMAGIPALGRQSDVQNLLLAANEINALVALAQFDQRIDMGKVVDMVLEGRSVDVQRVFKDPAKMEAEQAAAEQQAAANAQLAATANVADQQQVLQQMG